MISFSIGALYLTRRTSDLTLGRLLRRELETFIESLGTKITQEEFGKRADVSRKHLSEILNDKTGVEAKTLDRIVDALQIKGRDSAVRIKAIYKSAALPIPEYLEEDSETETDSAPNSSAKLVETLRLLDEEDREELLLIAKMKWQRKHPDETFPIYISSVLEEGDKFLSRRLLLSLDLMTSEIIGPNSEPVSEEDEPEVLRLAAQVLSMRLRKKPEPIHYETTLEQLRGKLGASLPEDGSGMLLKNINLQNSQ